MKDLLLVIDLQKVYADGEPWACRETGRVCERVAQLVDSGKPDQVIFTRFDAPEHPVGRWAEYNRAFAEINADPRLAEMMDPIAELCKGYPVYSKQTYSSLTIPEVAAAAAAADRVLVTGVVAECCVIATALALIDAGCEVVYLKDAVAGQSAAFEERVEEILGALAPVHTSVMTVSEYLAQQD
ncbi:MAG TPA: isochorismatase family protein [Candidatus Pygmaiobacter gallistercoris]|nr:isochorismatase family protein [Candidatus Pygmaiobacter gallistercoris]